MGLLGFGKKKNRDGSVPENLTAAPLGYWEEKSYFLVIPKKPYTDLLEGIFERVAAIPGVNITAKKLPGEESGTILLDYHDVSYEVGFDEIAFQLPDLMTVHSQIFTEEEQQELKSADRAWRIFMAFSEDSKTSFHLQLKLACAMVPELLAVMDESAEKMLCARWVKLAAEANTVPGSEALFSAQSILGDNGEVWIHTHGLCRCGLSELEILQSDREHMEIHYHVISTLASMLLDKNGNSDEDGGGDGNARMIAMAKKGQSIVVTYVPWTEGLKKYPVKVLGGVGDRKDGHNSRTGIIFAYLNETDYEHHILTKIPELDGLWGDNPLFLFSNEETARMKSLAMERFRFVREAFEKGTADKIYIKVGLHTDSEPGEEQSGGDNNFEHIWFCLLGFSGEKFKGRLLQEPYNVSRFHEGDEGEFTTDEVTDWIIYTETGVIHPEQVYLLV